MNYSYYNDSLNKYLVIPVPGAEDNPDGYQHRMIAANHIRGLLPCALRRIDQRCFLYYDITDRQTLQARYSGSRIGPGETEELLYRVAEVNRDVAGFLLDASQLLLDPELVYYDFASESYRFVYYPEAEDGGQTASLLSFLVGKAPMADQRTARAVLYLKDRCREPDFILQETLLDKAFGRETEAPAEDGLFYEDLDDDDAQEAHFAGFSETYGEDEEDDWLAPPVPEPEIRPEPEKRTGGREGTVFVFSLLFLAAALFMEWARLSLPLREEMLLLLDVLIIFSLAVTAALAVTGVILLGSFCAGSIKRLAGKADGG